ncbi:MAG TPA: STAS domain-containing protein [Streptosporangiaceae bacterium]|nr:STAS domain-containing protein [Streptosporangiaceae bacterium]
MPDARFPVETIGGVPVVRAPEDIDITNASDFREALLAAAERGAGSTVVDLSQTQFCDSADLHALVAAHKRARAADGEVRLVVSDPHVLRIFAISGLDQVIPCHGDVGQALLVLSGSHQASAAHQASPARCA